MFRKYIDVKIMYLLYFQVSVIIAITNRKCEQGLYCMNCVVKVRYVSVMLPRFTCLNILSSLNPSKQGELWTLCIKYIIHCYMQAKCFQVFEFK